MISIRQKGNFEKTEKFLKRSLGRNYMTILDKYALEGVAALSAITPVDTGLTASSWYYDIIQNEDGYSIVWKNANVQNGLNVAVLLQYGHATRNGGYVQGIDYINPALKPIFQKLADAAWMEVTKA